MCKFGRCNVYPAFPLHVAHGGNEPEGVGIIPAGIRVIEGYTHQTIIAGDHTVKVQQPRYLVSSQESQFEAIPFGALMLQQQVKVFQQDQFVGWLRTAPPSFKRLRQQPFTSAQLRRISSWNS